MNKGACSSAATSKSSSLGPSALKTIGNAASVKRKESSQSSAQSKEKKKKKSALDEIMEVHFMNCPSAPAGRGMTRFKPRELGFTTCEMNVFVLD